jgi:signal transduction histidine kinase
MNRKQKIQRIRWLMLFSQVLIAAFVFRWLQSEFEGEKMALQKNVFDQFFAAKSRVMDSLISKTLITPLLNDVHGFKIKTVYEKQFSGNEDTAQIIILNAQGQLLNEEWRGRPREEKADSAFYRDARVEIRIDSGPPDELLNRGLRMFISRMSSESAEEDFFAKQLRAGDTTLLKSYFSENLEKNHLPMNVQWVSNYAEASLPPPPFYYESFFFDQPYGARLDDYHSFLVKKMLPQLLFALLLLLVTSLAFVFSYRSLRHQLQLAEMKDNFISNMTHELKTPLATMKVALEALQPMDPVAKKETMKEYLHIASQEVGRLELLVNQVMNSVLMEKGEENFRPENVSLAALVEKSMAAMELNLQRRGAKIQFTNQAGEAWLKADPLHLQGVLFNLFDNSLKYAGESPEIAIHLSPNGDELILRFSDNGPGIPEEYFDKIFTKFFRVPQGHQHNVKGYGLGLNYVAEVMKHHGGNASVTNSKTGGCEFVLRFPDKKS